MSIFATKCPHCKVENVSLQIVGGAVVRKRPQHSGIRMLGTHMQCTNCDFPVCALFILNDNNDYFNDLDFSNLANKALTESRDITVHGLRAVDIWPRLEQARIPDHLEKDAERALLQAERNFEIAGNEEAAGIMYRRALEISLKKAFPGGPNNLSQLIKRLVKDGKLTDAIGEWADHIREIGNEAAHETGPLDRGDLIAMREFTDAVLRYAVSLPKEIEARRAATVPPDE